MRITKVNIPKSIANTDGLEHIKMDKLGAVVLIAGKNGSGKTRILNKVFDRFKAKPTRSEIDNITSNINVYKGNIEEYRKRIANLKERLKGAPTQGQRESYNDDISRYENAIKDNQGAIQEWEKNLGWDEVETIELTDNNIYVHLVPKGLVLSDSHSISKKQLIAHAKNMNAVGITHLQNGTFAKIQVVQDRWFSSSHPQSEVLQEEKDKAKQDYDKLKEIIKIFLDTSIGRTGDDEATLFGFPLGKTNLSDGQKILLQFCIAIYSQEASLKDLIIILDEPENHLHPSVIIETIERIQKCVSNGQVWIATHSIPLLAHFDPSLLWYVEKGKITHAGKIPEKVLHSLLGDENEVAKLQDFIGLPSQYATSRYAFDCLFEPDSVLTDSNDPQPVQIRNSLLSLSKTGKLRVLDYGCGKGRLISNITDLDDANQEKLIEHIDYIAYDKFDRDKEQCKNALTKVYGSTDKKYFNDLNVLESIYDKGSFHVVIMCNVLHEIDPKEWLNLFKEDGIISRLLCDEGILLLIEDQQIPVGEKAYQKGFLVLDTPQLKELFSISERDGNFTFLDHRGDGRLKAHHIPKNCLIRIDDKSRKAALKSMSFLAKERIIEIRNKEKSYKNGKLHGFWVQQFANAQLNLSEFE